ncbi:MAG: thioredoxin [Bacteroidia bacterium]|nr:thioredoxin [Bacteroidia bacterium]
MNKIAKTVFLVFIALIVFNGCQSSTSENVLGGTLSADEFEQKLNTTENPQIADVRTPEEYSEGFIKGAININYNSNTFETEITKMDKTKPVFVYCLSGGRSASAVSKMIDLGFKEIYELKGGMRAWRNSQKAIATQAQVIEPVDTGMTMDEYNQLLKTDKLVLVDFNAVWCAPCKVMSPILDEIAAEFKDKVNVVKIDVDKNKQVADGLQIENLPTFLLYKNGSIVWNNEGLTEKFTIVDAIKKETK